MIKSGAVVFSNGQRGVFISEEDLARGGDAFQCLIRRSHKRAAILDEAGYNVYKVMWWLKQSQTNYSGYDHVDRQFVKLDEENKRTANSST